MLRIQESNKYFLYSTDHLIGIELLYHRFVFTKKHLQKDMQSERGLLGSRFERLPGRIGSGIYTYLEWLLPYIVMSRPSMVENSKTF